MARDDTSSWGGEGCVSLGPLNLIVETGNSAFLCGVTVQGARVSELVFLQCGGESRRRAYSH